MEIADRGQRDHGKLVMSSLYDEPGLGAGIDNSILASWRRCLEDFDLVPDRPPEPALVERSDLKDRQERCCHLVEIARAEMTNLYQQVAGSGCSILLTDSDGVVMNYVGDPQFTTAAARAGLQTGAIWSEAAQGTNGMGTCLVEKRPLVIHQNEHFYSKNTRLTCSAAPIFAPAGDLLAVLDVSSESSRAQQHTMVLVNMSAQLIENRLFLCKMRDNYILRFHSRPEFVSTLGEGAIAFDAGGRIQAANRSALFQLDLKNMQDIVGQPLEELFSIRADAALGKAHGTHAQPHPLREIRQGRRFFASFQAPAEALRTSRGTSAPVRSGPRPAAPCGNLLLEQLEFGDTRMKRNIERARKLVEKDIPFMILGETGTGKDMFAKAVHLASSRSEQPFVAVNCASLPETLIESELFGYRPGAFTGASREGSRGKILQANGGVLFLDEIGDMPLNLQARLLRVLEEREVIPLGGETPIKVDIRLISATHQDLKQQVADGGFREDLYYRLHGISLCMPPLRDREDGLELIQRLLLREAAGQEIRLEEDALEALAAYDWPGNIRQLRNVLRTLVGLCDDNAIRLNDLPEEILVAGGDADGERPGARPSDPLAIAERDAMLRELEAAHWNVTRVASKLNLSRNTLYRKMKRYAIRPPR